MADDLGAPLKRRRDRRPTLPGALTRLPYGRIVLGLVAVIGLGVTARIVLVNEPMGGRPSAEAPVTSSLDNNPVALGVGNKVTITADPEMIPVPARPDTPAADIGIAEIDSRGVYPDLAEESGRGPLPRIGSDGRTPFNAYARAGLAPGASGGRPLVALVVTGLGLSEAGTLDAITALPEAVTLAFAPYGKSLARSTAAARAEGHELFLEVPLEPFDYPDNDPGPDTLLTGQTPRQNIDRLLTVMASFGGYAGLINNMGARFTASAADFSPMMEELGARGLGYLDDGSSNRSLAPQLAGTNKVPFARASRQIDAEPSRGAILAALTALEADAKANGSALGVLSALPVSITTVAEWARTAAERGIVLVPATSLMQ